MIIYSFFHQRSRRNVHHVPHNKSRWQPSNMIGYRNLKLQALVYDIFPSTIAVFIYAIGSRKLSANEHFFVDAQTVVSMLQTTPVVSDVCFMLPCCLRQLKQNQNRLNRDRTFFPPFFFSFFLFHPGWVDAPHVYVGAGR